MQKIKDKRLKIKEVMVNNAVGIERIKIQEMRGKDAVGIEYL